MYSNVSIWNVSHGMCVQGWIISGGPGGAGM